MNIIKSKENKDQLNKKKYKQVMMQRYKISIERWSKKILLLPWYVWRYEHCTTIDLEKWNKSYKNC